MQMSLVLGMVPTLGVVSFCHNYIVWFYNILKLN